jgi:hypothetical protein
MTPYFGGVAVRYDTAALINATGSYEKFQAFGPNTYGYNCAAFDGKYVYYAPYAGPVLTSFSGLMRRYDTTKAFTQSGSWLTYDVSAVDANAVAFDMTQKSVDAHGFLGMVFDGHFVYYVPYAKTVAVRFDAKSPSSLPTFHSSLF